MIEEKEELVKIRCLVRYYSCEGLSMVKDSEEDVPISLANRIMKEFPTWFEIVNNSKIGLNMPENFTREEILLDEYKLPDELKNMIDLKNKNKRTRIVRWNGPGKCVLKGRDEPLKKGDKIRIKAKHAIVLKNEKPRRWSLLPSQR